MIYLVYGFKTAFANVREEMDNIFAEANCERIKKSEKSAALNRPTPPLFRAHPHHVLHRIDEDLAVPGLARLGKLADEVDDSLCILVIDHHLQLYLLQELHPVVSGPPLQGDALLPAPA